MQLQLEMDYESSTQYLLELVRSEPTVVHAIRTLQSQTLHGHIHCRINGRTASLRFLQFVNRHYFKFAEDAIQSAISFGFVPWYKRRLASGDLVPTVLPLGSFSWEVKAASQMKPGLVKTSDRGKVLLYDIALDPAVHNTLRREDVIIHEHTPPAWQVGRYTLNASVTSPLQSIVTTYRRLVVALSNRAHADAWNSHAHIITRQATTQPTQEPTASIFEAGEQVDSIYSYEDCKIQLQTRDEDIQNQFTKKVAQHVPYVYTLPVNVGLEQAPVLQPCGDVAFLQEKFKRDVALAFGIPLDVVGLNGTVSSERSNLQTQQNDHLFHTHVSRFRRMLTGLMEDAYREIYLRGRNTGERVRAEIVEFTVVPASGLRLRSVEDIAKLASVEGAIPPNELSRITKELIYGDGVSQNTMAIANDTPQVGSTSNQKPGKRSVSTAQLSDERGSSGVPRR
jgi:hypothetical protein